MAELRALAPCRRANGHRISRVEVGVEVEVEVEVGGLLAGCQSLTELEALTERMSAPMRRWLGIGRRVPDTTLRRARAAS